MSDEEPEPKRRNRRTDYQMFLLQKQDDIPFSITRPKRSSTVTPETVVMQTGGSKNLVSNFTQQPAAAIHEKKTSLDDENIIISRHSLEDFLMSNFVCHHCRSTITAADLNFTQFGIATTIQFSCCGNTSHGRRCPSKNVLLEPKKRIESKEKELQPGSGRSRNIDFELNTSLVLGSQLAGIGQREATKFMSVLRLTQTSRVLSNAWGEIEEFLSLKQIRICGKVVEQNLEEEIQA